MTKRFQETCNCEAYDFPHRIYSGNCYGHDMLDCPNPKTIADPYCTGDTWYHHMEHNCYEARRKEVRYA